MTGDLARVDEGLPSVDTCKTVATLRARLALRGYVLAQCRHGSFRVTRWGQTRVLDGLADVERFAVQVGAGGPGLRATTAVQS